MNRRQAYKIWKAGGWKHDMMPVRWTTYWAMLRVRERLRKKYGNAIKWPWRRK